MVTDIKLIITYNVHGRYNNYLFGAKLLQYLQQVLLQPYTVIIIIQTAYFHKDTLFGPLIYSMTLWIFIDFITTVDIGQLNSA